MITQQRIPLRNLHIVRSIIRNMAQLAFVYGTLKKNEPNHHWMTNPNNGIAKFIAVGHTATKYPLIIATKYNIPFLLYKPGVGHNVQGEVYEVDDLMLSKLDILEDHPKYYERTIDDIKITKGDKTETVRAWVYFLKNFKDGLLKKEMLRSYTSSGPHGLVYKDRSLRDPNYNYKLEIMDKQE